MARDSPGVVIVELSLLSYVTNTCPKACVEVLGEHTVIASGMDTVIIPQLC